MANQQIWSSGTSHQGLSVLLDEQDVARGCSRELLKANVIFDTVDKP
jgi:hypothetical protein